MTIDRIEYYEKYSFLGPRFAEAFHLLNTTDYSKYEAGRYEVEPESIYLLVQEYQSKSLENATIEVHRKYADIHTILQGREHVGYADLSTLRPGEYVAERDFQQVFGKTDLLTMSVGLFMVLFPNDGHMPGVRIGESESVKKVVFKVRL